MNATTNPLTAVAARIAKPASGGVCRFVVNVGETPCELRARPIAMIAEVLGFEEDLAGDLMDFAGDTADSHLIADLLDSRMIDRPQQRRRRQRPVSSRALFYAATGGVDSGRSGDIS